MGGGRLGDWAPQAELGRLLWHERDTLLQELAGLPPVAVPSLVRPHRHRPGLLAAAAAMSGPEPPASLAGASLN